jgi:Ca-activated chloride channel homolog
MKKPNKTQIFILGVILTFVTIVSVAAYLGVKGKASGIRTNNPQTTVSNKGNIQFSTTLDNSYYYDNKHVYLYVDLKAGKAGSDRERSPLNVSVVIDRSGSMADKNKLTYVKRSVDYIIDQLNEGDYISLVTYDDYIDILQRSAKNVDKYELRQKVSKVEPGGFTNLSEGMFEGYSQVDKTYSRGYVNRVLLLSDGLANRGVTNRFKLADMVREKNRKDGITLSTFGVGNDFNENLMTDIADYGKGNYYYIRDSEQIPEIFASELKGIRNLVGGGTKVKIKFPAKFLQLNKVFGYPYDINGDEVTIDFKDVFSEQTKSVLIKFDIKEKIDSKLDFASELSYEDVTSDFKNISETQFVSLKVTSNKKDYDKAFDKSVQQNIATFEANAIMEEALREADNGNYDIARSKVQSGKEYLEDQMKTIGPSPSMEQQSESMDKYNEKLKDAEKKTDEEKNEMQKSGKYDNYNSRKKNQ